ncbi:MAG: YgjV family protein [Acidobacteria bacterium]|nr:YgjV family protein [Acidobacteriota bacterium]
MGPEWIGWIATAAFASSYFCKEARTLRLIQGMAAILWIGYGVFIQATPVVVANVIVAAAAGYSTFRQSKELTGTN